MKNNQITGNVGMYYICYQLSLRGMNVMPTARNAKGIDVLAYDDAGRFVTIQVKSLSKRSPVPLGKNLDSIMGDVWCIVVMQKHEDPRVYIMKPEEVRRLQKTSHDGKGSHWLQPKEYEPYRDRWERIRGC